MGRRKVSKEVYDKIIKNISTEIINMLPDKPENLLKYATRVEKINVSKGVSDEVKQLMEQHLLSDEEYLKTFYYVMAITFIGKKTVENPEVAIVAAQTGSGKSNLTAKLLRNNDNYIFIDSDKYKHFRYDAQKIARKYQVLYPFLTGPDAYDHAQNIYDYAIEHKYNIIKETAPSSSKGLIGLDEKLLKEKNYSISVHILSVGKLNSLLSIHERYELQIINGLKTAKLTGITRHNESYDALIDNVKDIMQDEYVEAISVYKRGILENSFDPIKIYPGGKYETPIDAVIMARQEDNSKTAEEFMDRYNLVVSQMDKRNAPKEQYEQISEIKNEYERKKYMNDSVKVDLAIGILTEEIAKIMRSYQFCKDEQKCNEYKEKLDVLQKMKDEINKGKIIFANNVIEKKKKGIL